MIGKTLGNFTLEAQIGKGGMGEVYKAKDQKLGRDVAIKVLPEEFAKDADRIARFQREAKLLASLNHPNIAAIYGLEESDGTHFLVLELIEGDTLADRIKSGPIPVEESLKLALQSAEALEAAHEKGVIHRDLKPANIKVTPDGKVKVLDFGLAKAFAGEQAEVNLSHSPTLSVAVTMQGVILGTAAYMSPEQARGKPVDKRTDIWAFGCVLYEMLTGKAAFQGEDVTEILAAVVKSGVNLDLLPANIHPRVCEVITRCLQKDQKKRYPEISQAQYEIEQVLADQSGVFAQPVEISQPRNRLRLVLPWVAVAVVLTAIIAGIAGRMMKPQDSRLDGRFAYMLPEGQAFSDAGWSLIAVSPDDKKIVYESNGQLYLRNLNELTARPIRGTDENPFNPFFSPDGQWVGYWSSKDNKLRKISVSGGAPITLCNATDASSASWNTDNTIVYGETGKGIMRVSANGGNPELLVKAKEGGLFRSPQVLPGGKWILFTIASTAGGWDTAQIVVQSLESGERKVLVNGGSNARYVPTGHLVYALEDVLYATAFDADSLEVEGGAVPIAEGVRRALTSFTDAANYDFSDGGLLAYVVGGAETKLRSLVWVDQNGKEEPLGAAPNAYSHPRISPDGKRVAIEVETGGNSDIWIWDLSRKTMARLTFDKATDIYPLWTPNGKQIVFASNREGTNGVYLKAADGTGEVELVGSVPGRRIYPYSWSGDGKTLLLDEDPGVGAPVDIGAMSMEGDHSWKPLLQGEYVESIPQIAPDGRWLAYFSMESGSREVYVRPFPDVNSGKWQVSTSGGWDPRWSRSGRELFYRAFPQDEMMLVTVETEATFKAGVPETLFRGTYFAGVGSSWDLSPDGKRFLMIKPAESTAGAAAAPDQINIVLNWFEELKQRVPVK